MRKEKWASPGARLRYVRKEILHMTQEKLAEELGVTRSLIPAMELDKQGISRTTVEKLYADYGINATWLISGDGQPLGESDRPPATDENVMMTEKSVSYEITGASGRLFLDPAFYRDAARPGRFGYVKLSGTRLRLHAARDNLLDGSNLYKLVEDDKLWIVAGEPIGWEFEVLREYYAAGKDRSVGEWLECLRLVRWCRRAMVEATAGSAGDVGEVRSA